MESWFHLQLEDSDYLLAYMREQDIAKAQEIGRKSQFPIDQAHNSLKTLGQK